MEERNERTVILTKPILDGTGKETKILNFPDPLDVSLGQLGALDEAKGSFSQIPYLISSLCNVPVSEAKRICIKDMKAINEVLGDFLL